MEPRSVKHIDEGFFSHLGAQDDGYPSICMLNKNLHGNVTRREKPGLWVRKSKFRRLQ